MRHFKIVKPLVLAFIVDDEQQDFLLSEGHLEFDGSTVWLVTPTSRFESITSANVIEHGLVQGLLVEVVG
jgi:hypothetical protein